MAHIPDGGRSRDVLDGTFGLRHRTSRRRETERVDMSTRVSEPEFKRSRQNADLAPVLEAPAEVFKVLSAEGAFQLQRTAATYHVYTDP